MKLVFVIDSWNGGNGGVIAMQRFVQELSAKGHDISVISTGQHQGQGYSFYEVPGFYLPGVRESLEKMDFLFAKGTKSILRTAYQGADLVLIQFPFFIARNAVKIAKEMGIPVIGASHVQPQNIIAAMGKEDPILEKMLQFIFNFCLYYRVQVLHCPSTFAAHLLYQKGVRAHFRIISNGIPREYQPKPMERPAWFSNRFVILNIGRHALEKRQELIIDAVKRSRNKENIQLVFCGRGENTRTLIEKSQSLPITPFIGYVSEEDKLLYLNTADMYVHASVVELESLSCLEAVGCGLPCMIGNSPYSAAPQFAPDERLVFEMDDVEELTRKIDYWVDNREELIQQRIKTLEMAEHYRMEKCVTELEELFADVVSGKQLEIGIFGELADIHNNVHLPKFQSPAPILEKICSTHRP